MVGNDEILRCEGMCPAVPLRIQKEIFLVDFYILPIQGVEIVLGVQWLQLLGPIVLDYQKLTMEFSWQNEKIQLQGEQHGSQKISLNQLMKLLKKGVLSSMLQITLLKEEVPIPVLEVNQEIEQLSVEFQDLFIEPTSLPPHQMLDHEIHLLPNSVPVNICLYKHPHFQKTKIEKQVSDMLTSSVIRHSTYLFSSPVLLVKKEDGTWKLCIDYRALNNITIMNRFPIPTTDELMDELGGATIFSKLDLRASYHQI